MAPPPSPNPVDYEDVIKTEIEASRKELRPTSRHEIAEVLSEKFRLPQREAIALVDIYCEEKEPGIPDYLAEEFNIGWLKFVAIGMVVVGLVFLFNGVRTQRIGNYPWYFWSLGALFFGLGAFSWVRSLENTATRAKRRLAKQTKPK